MNLADTPSRRYLAPHLISEERLGSSSFGATSPLVLCQCMPRDEPGLTDVKVLKRSLPLDVKRRQAQLP